ncbi:MAG: hypothetical protein JW860_08385 [Sedimentisphaerales bacterium]|nr:hypothetical protein [Sedimentisphaerales bacterium]
MSKALDLVPVMFAQTMAEAEFYRVLLEDHDITVFIGGDDKAYELADGREGVPLLVPQDQVEDAELVIEQRSTSDDEFDEAIDSIIDEEDEFDELDSVGPKNVDLDDLDDEEDFI